MQYTFTHSLTHDVTYNGVLLERRRDIHARIVDAIEKLYAGRLGEQVERLAHHAVRGDLKDKAVHYLRQSGAKAAARSALSDARTCLEQALDIIKRQPESPNTLEQGFDDSARTAAGAATAWRRPADDRASARGGGHRAALKGR